jgi:hypothetical protein
MRSVLTGAVGDGFAAAGILTCLWVMLGFRKGRPGIPYGVVIGSCAAWYVGYSVLRLVVPPGATKVAVAHARTVELLSGGAAVERVCMAVLHPAVGVLTVYYDTAHLWVSGCTIVWLARRRPARFRQAAPWLAVASTAALLVFWAYPVAPPRTLGFGTFGLPAVLARGALPYAAVPSLHVAWAIWCDWALWPTVRKLRPLLGMHTVLTILAVVGTGNHWLFDVVTGAGLLVAARMLCRGAAAVAARRAAAAAPVNTGGPRCPPGKTPQAALHLYDRVGSFHKMSFLSGKAERKVGP